METQAGWCAAGRGKVPHVPCKAQGGGWGEGRGPPDKRYRDME